MAETRGGRQSEGSSERRSAERYLRAIGYLRPWMLSTPLWRMPIQTINALRRYFSRLAVSNRQLQSAMARSGSAGGLAMSH
jgi:hypothetical protein